MNYDFFKTKLTYLKELAPVKCLYNMSQEKNEPLYLVGGFIRDALLGKNTLDLDFTMKGDAVSIGRDLSKNGGGSFVLLDDERGTARVIFKNTHGEIVIDLCHFQGETLEEDLLNRDFTINALALPMEAIFGEDCSVEKIINLSGGIEDLNKKLIKAISRKSLETDPLRLLRAYRFQALTGFDMDVSTRDWIGELVPTISKVSVERVRDEFFYLLSVARSFEYVKELARVGLLKFIFSHKFHEFGIMFEADSSLGNHSMNCFDILEELMTENFELFKEWQGDIDKHFDQILASHRRRREILKIASLFTGLVRLEREVMKKVSDDFDIASSWGELIYLWSQQFKLSVLEGKTLRKIVESFSKPASFNDPDELSKRDIFLFLRDVDNVAIETLFLALADAIEEYTQESQKEELGKRKAVIYNFIREYFIEDRVDIRTQRFLTGDDLMELFNIPEGPEIGRILDLLDEAQGIREIKSGDEAMLFVENLLNEPDVEEELPEEEREE